MRPFYIPSGKYRPYAPIILGVLTFLSVGISGLAYGAACSEFFLHHYVEVGASALWILVLLCINSYLICSITTNMQIRNPKLVKRVCFYTSAIAWQLNWFSLYWLSYHTTIQTSFLSFVSERFFSEMAIGLLSRVGAPNFTAHWYYMLVGWLVEAFFLPYLLAKAAYLEARKPFSEECLTWYNRKLLPTLVFKPDHEEFMAMLKRGDDEGIMSVRPNLYNQSQFMGGGWTKLALFFPTSGNGQIYVHFVHGTIMAQLMDFKKSREPLYRYWCVSEEEAETFKTRFGKGDE